MPRGSSYLDWPAPIAQAHRGTDDLVAENTIESFATIVALGYRYIETDIRTTLDGVPVLFHDETTDRTTGQIGRIDALRFTELKDRPLHDGRTIPSLTDILQAFPSLRFSLDLKDQASAAAVSKALTESGATDRVCVTSFSDARIAAAHALLGDDVCYGVGSHGAGALAAAALLGCSSPIGPSLRRGSVIQLPWSQNGVRVVRRRLVRAAHRMGLKVHVWTLNDEDTMTRALDLGVDGVITDRPTILRDVLIGRDEWVDGS
jgi:glycerophosphoryl diester phosphodiesterase